MPKHISEVLKGERYSVVVRGTLFLIASEEDTFTFRGHGGNPFLFKLKDSGEVVYSTNVWNAGEINKPDTAEIMEYSDWASVGVNEFGRLKEDSNVFVYSDKVLVHQ